MFKTIGKGFLWGLLTAIAFLIGYFGQPWLETIIRNPAIAAGIAFSFGFWSGVLLNKLGVPG